MLRRQPKRFTDGTAGQPDAPDLSPGNATYNRLVRRAVVTVMLAVFATLNAIDGICCPDGCTHERESPIEQQSPHSPEGVCMLCLGGIDSAMQQDLSPCAIVTTRVTPVQPTQRLDAPTDPLDHPPRF
jgi:hypothetical protein